MFARWRSSSELHLPSCAALLHCGLLYSRHPACTWRLPTFHPRRFVFIIFATVQWIGCIYYLLAEQTDFGTELYNVNWVTTWATATYADFKPADAEDPWTPTYVVILFKGFQMLTHLGYQSTVPQREDEMIAAILAQNVKIILNAYILGAATHTSPRARDPSAFYDGVQLMPMRLQVLSFTSWSRKTQSWKRTRSSWRL